MASTRHGVSLLGLVLLSIVGFARADTDALWLEPSSNWYGIDGNWSAMGLYVGAPEQQVDVLVSTSLSEIWVIESNGCGASALCTAARGNVFNISASTDWESLGAWELGLEYLEQVANGDYATEAIAVYNTATQNQTNLDKQIVAAINDTDYYTGFFGLGITPGRFKTTVVQSPIATLVEIDGIIPSHSYGYTAGAYYGGQYGTPMSLVLGGYDQNRFVSHDTEFSLNSTTRQPEALVRAITASMSSTDQALAGWNSTSVSLSSFDESVVALVDSSTPYLWLPTVICDRFADALNLTWNETFGLYTFASNATYESYFDTSLAFTFSLSSSDNRDNFGDPLNVAGVVNITISANAFAQTLRYPFMNLFQYGDAAIPYFPLRRADNGTQIIIGRSFLQESYIKMNYESSTFSLHQALFPDNPDTNTTIITVQSSADNPYPSAASSSGPTGGALGTAAIVGIVVGACIVLSFIALIVFCVRRRRKQQNGSMMEADSFKDTTSSVESECPRTPVARIFSRITRTFTAKRSRRVAAYEVSGDTAQPFEAAGQERYELAVPPPPVELDATDAHSINGTTEFGTDDSHNLSPYEIARRKMDKQLQGPVPVYTPGPSPIESHGIGYEKSYQDVSSVPHHRRSETSLFSENRSLSPASTPTYDEYSYLTPSPIPSPMTPHHMDWPPHEMPNISSPMPFPPQNTMPRSTSNPGSGYAPSSPYTLERRRSISRSASIAGSPTSPISHFAQHMHSFQRTPIDQQKVVCLGPLPSGIRPPGPTVPARSGSSAVQDFAMPTISSAAESRRQSIAETLGSNFTVEEEEIIMNEIEHNGTFGGHGLAGAMIEEEEPELSADHTTGGHGQFELIHIPERPIPASVVSDAGRLQGRVDFVHVPTPVDPTVTPTSATQRLNGFDLVHVPQPAQKRYSWEASSPQ